MKTEAFEKFFGFKREAFWKRSVSSVDRLNNGEKMEAFENALLLEWIDQKIEALKNGDETKTQVWSKIVFAFLLRWKRILLKAH